MNGEKTVAFLAISKALIRGARLCLHIVVWTPILLNFRTPKSQTNTRLILSRFFNGFLFCQEVWPQISGRELANLSPQFAVKLRSFLNPLIINELQNSPNFDIFVKIIYQFPPMLLSTFPPQTTGSSFRLYQPKTFRRLSGFKGRKKANAESWLQDSAFA